MKLSGVLLMKRNLENAMIWERSQVSGFLI